MGITDHIIVITILSHSILVGMAVFIILGLMVIVLIIVHLMVTDMEVTVTEDITTVIIVVMDITIMHTEDVLQETPI
jgi:hypothetical protein